MLAVQVWGIFVYIYYASSYPLEQSDSLSNDTLVLANFSSSGELEFETLANLTDVSNNLTSASPDPDESAITTSTLTPEQHSSKRRKASRRHGNFTARPITSTATPASTEKGLIPEETDEIELALSNLFDEAPSVVTYNYVVIIDAGSSHTDLVIYKWPITKINGTGLVTEEKHLVCQAALSSFRNKPEDAGASMKDCLNYASLQVPKHQWNSTRVLLGATAGMRVLRENNATVADMILESVASFIREHYNFHVEDQHIKILSPEQEGGFSWISINYIKKVLVENAKYEAENRLQTFGSLDLGGASTQFTSEVTKETTNKIRPSFRVMLFGHEYKIYTRSYLCYGKNEAYRRYKALLLTHRNFSEPIVDPCRPAGYKMHVERTFHFDRPCSNTSVPQHHSREQYDVLGSGNADECLLMVRQLFTKTMDLVPSSCPFQDKECAFKGIEKGKVRGKFLGTGAFYYDTRNLQVLSGDAFSLDPFDAAGYRTARQTICGKQHSEIQLLINRKPELKAFFLRQCFDATYLQVLLGEVYNLSDEVLGNTTFAKKIDGVDVGWTLGWAVAASSDLPGSGYTSYP